MCIYTHTHTYTTYIHTYQKSQPLLGQLAHFLAHSAPSWLHLNGDSNGVFPAMTPTRVGMELRALAWHLCPGSHSWHAYKINKNANKNRRILMHGIYSPLHITHS